MEATPLMVGGVLYTTAGFRPNVVAIDAATGETLWTYRLDEGRAAIGRRAASRAASNTGPTANRRASSWSRAVISSCRSTPRRVCPIRHSARTASSISIRISISRRPGRRHQLDIARRRGEERDRLWRRNGGRNGAAIEGKHQGIHPRLRRALGKTPVDVPHDSAAGRVRQRHVAERLVVVHR